MICMYIVIGYQLGWTFLSGSLPFSFISICYYCLFTVGKWKMGKTIANIFEYCEYFFTAEPGPSPIRWCKWLL